MSEQYTNRLLKIATNHITREIDEFARQYDMTWMQMSVIDYLSRKTDQEIFQRDIEQEFFIQRSTTTVLLQRMEKHDLLYRQTSTTDARQRSVYLTDKARNVEKQINQFMKHHQDRLEANFTTSEITTFEKILKFYTKEGTA